MKKNEIAKEISNVMDMQANVCVKMIEDIKDTLVNEFGGCVDWFDYETDNDDVWTPTMDYFDYYSCTCEECVHMEQIKCNDDGGITITLENDETTNINDLSFQDLSTLYLAMANLCDYLGK